jgi:copper chaperone CopZ
METIKLIIPNMKSPHCQMTVSNAVKRIGADVKNISSQQAELTLPEHITKDDVIKAITTAGYHIA